MNPSYSRPVFLDPLFSQPVSLCDMFHTYELTGCGGKTFQLDLEIVWYHVDALCFSWNVMEPGWAKACPDRWVSHFGDWSRRGFQNIVWFVCWMGWNPVNLQQPASALLLNLRNCGPESFFQGISRCTYSYGIALQRIPSHSTYTHRSSYSTKGIVYQKTVAYSQKPFFWKK